jgi:hypothetical protein
MMTAGARIVTAIRLRFIFLFSINRVQVSGAKRFRSKHLAILMLGHQVACQTKCQTTFILADELVNAEAADNWREQTPNGIINLQYKTDLWAKHKQLWLWFS